MANFILLAVAVFATTVASQQLIAPRLIGGTPADTLRRFPHHVTIKSYCGDEKLICGGSILSEQWILTSAFCVDQHARLELQFERLFVNSTVGSYSALVNSDAVHIYPTYYDDIALVKLPFRLVFSDLIKPVSISSQPLSQLENKLAVLPGFDVYGVFFPDYIQMLTYAMLNVISDDKCKQYYTPGYFDEYLQFCAEGYKNNMNSPCFSDYGSGLLSGWPAKSELIGIFAKTGYDCFAQASVYTDVAKYASWIKSVINS